MFMKGLLFFDSVAVCLGRSSPGAGTSVAALGIPFPSNRSDGYASQSKDTPRTTRDAPSSGIAVRNAGWRSEGMTGLIEMLRPLPGVFFGAAVAALSSVSLAAPPLPDIAQGKGEECVEPTDDMRRNHMNYILHQRDETVHKGVRTKQHSLVECINCHVLPRTDGSFPRSDQTEHFCTSCHVYAAVKIDCFQCHADHPMNEAEKTDTASTANDASLATSVMLAAEPDSGPR